MKKTRQGIALALVLMVAAITVLLMFTLTTTGLQNLAWSTNAKEQAVSFYAAEAGVNKAEYVVEVAETSTPGGPIVPLTTSAPWSWATTENIVAQSGAPNAGATLAAYSVTASATFNPGAPGPVVTIVSTAQDKPLPVGVPTANGNLPKYERQITVKLQTGSGGWPYKFAFLANTQLNIFGGGHGDSYDSANGQNNTNVANIGVVNTANGALNVAPCGGSQAIDGDLVVGFGGSTKNIDKGKNVHAMAMVVDPSPVIFQTPLDNNSPSYTASSIPYTTLADSPGTPMTASPSPGAYNDLTIVNPGTVITLAPGNYSFNNVTIENGASVVISPSATLTSPVQLHVYGSYTEQGAGPTYNSKSGAWTSTGEGGMTNLMTSISGLNGNAYPSTHLLIYGMPSKTTGAGPPMSISTVSGKLPVLFVGAMYAPWSTINLDGTGYYHGSVVGNFITITGTNTDVNLYGNGDGNLTYDEALANDPQAGTKPPITILSWTSR